MFGEVFENEIIERESNKFPVSNNKSVPEFEHVTYIHVIDIGNSSIGYMWKTRDNSSLQFHQSIHVRIGT